MSVKKYPNQDKSYVFSPLMPVDLDRLFLKPAIRKMVSQIITSEALA